MKSSRRAFTLVEAIVVVVVLAIFAAILFPVNRRTPYSLRRATCQSNLKQIGIGFLQYAQDADEKLPVLTRPQGWVGLLQPYLKSKEIFHCPSETERGDANLSDYWMNRRVAGVESKHFADVSATLLMGDGLASDNGNVAISSLPSAWIATEDSPARRHINGANYGFLDGHVKWFIPKNVSVKPPGKNNNATFLFR